MRFIILLTILMLATTAQVSALTPVWENDHFKVYVYYVTFTKEPSYRVDVQTKDRSTSIILESIVSDLNITYTKDGVIVSGKALFFDGFVRYYFDDTYFIKVEYYTNQTSTIKATVTMFGFNKTYMRNSSGMYIVHSKYYEFNEPSAVAFTYRSNTAGFAIDSDSFAGAEKVYSRYYYPIPDRKSITNGEFVIVAKPLQKIRAVYALKHSSDDMLAWEMYDRFVSNREPDSVSVDNVRNAAIILLVSITMVLAMIYESKIKK